MPAIPRDQTACTVFFRLAWRMASASPGTSVAITRRVASGVRSVGATPVPPVVTIRSRCSASDHCSRVVTISSSWSGITS